mgnify:CR=1 FL=1
MERMFYKCNSLITNITIKNSNTTYTDIFYGTAINEGAEIIVNYTSDASEIVDNMISTKSDASNVVKGELVS